MLIENALIIECQLHVPCKLVITVSTKLLSVI